MAHLLTALRKAFFSPSKPKRSYSQYGEDLLVAELLKQSEVPHFYVDVGCHHPRRGSNTYALYRKGWHGVLIDLEDAKVLACKLARPRDRVIKAAVSNCRERVEIYSRGAYSTNTTIDAETGQNPSSGLMRTGAVDTETLSEILQREHCPADFGLLNIDVEGVDLKVLQGLDLSAYRPRIVCVENWEARGGIDRLLGSDLHLHLEARNYSLAGWSGLSTIYCRRA